MVTPNSFRVILGGRVPSITCLYGKWLCARTDGQEWAITRPSDRTDRALRVVLQTRRGLHTHCIPHWRRCRRKRFTRLRWRTLCIHQCPLGCRRKCVPRPNRVCVQILHNRRTIATLRKLWR